MANPGTAQALIAAFFFGILFNAASPSLALYIKGHGSAIFRDGLRLVLILFLASSALWALVEFLATLIEPTATSTCQVAVIFSSAFDQLARVFVEQYLVWSVHKDEKRTVWSTIPQLLVLGRFALGAAFVGETRSDFNPTCVPASNLMPIAITVIVLDAVILAILAIRALSAGSTNDVTGGRRLPGRSKSIVFVVIGLTIWMGMSVPLLLGMKTIDLVLRTTLPALGLTILVALVLILSGTLVVPRNPPPRQPDSPTSRDIGRDRDLSSSDSADYPPTRYEDVKEINTRSMSAFVAPRNNGPLPKISMTVNGESGIGGVPVQGNLFPPAQTTQSGLAAVPKAPGNGDRRKEMDSRQRNGGKGIPSAKGSGKLAISHPILKEEEEGMKNPLSRIPTIDLATAASNEKERRARLAQRMSTFITQRPAPQPPNASKIDETLSSDEGAKQEDISSSSPTGLTRSISTKTAKTAGGSSFEANATSTSSRLSPGTEGVRRRSPRQPPAPPVPATFQPIRPGEPIRIPIPRPQSPKSEPTKTPEPVKTPLQRRPTNGLPSNPRAQAMKAMAQEGKGQRQETVMFVNNIVYDDPNAVSDIVQGASKTPMTSLDSADSVLHRPRPIPRKGDKDRQVFPAEVSPSHSHRRSRSGGSIVSRKSVLQSKPGSPTQLPPLPPPPKSAGNPSRPHPNDTKSMTFDEKMNLFYSTQSSAPSTSRSTSRRRSSVPDIPPVPSAYAKDQSQPVVEEDSDSESNVLNRTSRVTDKSTVRTTSILGIEELPQGLPHNSLVRTASSRSAADELGDSWLPGLSIENDAPKRPSNPNTNRKSSPVIPAVSHMSISTRMSETRTRDEEVASNWGSVHSPVAAVNVQKLRVRSTYIQKNARGLDPDIRQRVPSSVGEEVVPVMLDTSGHSPDDRKVLPTKEDENSFPAIPAAESSKAGGFHHRIGEECPTFSTRKDQARSRKGPPPTPLILNGKRNQRAIMVQPAEPSPLESPEAVYQMIQSQLQNFEQPNRQSVESQGQRLELLEDLEREMGQLEDKWQSTQNRLDRDSMSSYRTSPSKDSRPNSIASKVSGELARRSLASDRRVSRKSIITSGATMRSKNENSSVTPSSQSSGMSSENTQASLWQVRLAEAQMGYMENSRDLVGKRNNLNFLTVSKAALISPSPPDTEESESESEIQKILQPLDSEPKPIAQIHQLWKPSSPVKLSDSAGLWAATGKKPAKTDEAHGLPGLSVRPAIRKTSESLAIESSQLWQKPIKSDKEVMTKGLWRKQSAAQYEQSQRAVNRPLTIRPPRRNKRVTLLPDILESPKPLPDKRGTLGIFQFPWGEKSEHARVPTYQPSQMYMAMPGTMTSGRPSLNATLESRSRQLEADESTMSFFDEYEREDDDDNLAFSDSEGDDDFDETTLWEIASLLKTENVPSSNSLIFNPAQASAAASSSIFAEYADAEEEDEEPVEFEMVSEDSILFEHPHLPTPKSDLAQPLLWSPKSKLTESRNNGGLPQLDSWESYILDAGNAVRSPPRTEEIRAVESTQLWAPNKKVNQVVRAAALWVPNKPTHEDSTTTSQTNKATNPQANALLWARPDSSPASENKGLFDISCFRLDYRRTSKEPAALSTRRTPRVTKESITQLMTNRLWAKEEPTKSSLWEKPTVIHVSEVNGLFDPNTPRTDYRGTPKEPAAISTTRTARINQEPLAMLTTKSLWSKETPVPAPSAPGPQLFRSTKPTMLVAPSVKSTVALKSQTSLLWEQPIEMKEPLHKGLFDATITRFDYRRTPNAPAAVSMFKKPRPTMVPLPKLTTTSLWTGETPTQLVSTSEPLSTKVASPVQSSWLWEVSTRTFSEVDHEGLFDANAARLDYRRTSKQPAAITMSRNPRITKESLASLTSTKLWEAQHMLARASPSGTPSLWTKPTVSKSAGPSLFQLDPNREVYRTTSAEPAALQMDRKLRTIEGPLPKLESTRLWNNSQVTSVELDWITISSVRPRSPSVTSNSTVSSAPSSPVTDASSIKSSTTKASSVKSKAGFFSSLFGKKEPEVPEVPKLPEHPELNKSKVEIPAVPEFPEELVVKNLDEITRTKPAHIPLRQQHRPVVAYRVDWDKELRDAIMASYPGTMFSLRASYPRDWDMELQAAIKASHIAPKVTRRAASPREWSAALQEAIAASYPDFRFSRGQTLPLKMEAELKEAIVKGEESQSAIFDVAVRHPVFFGSMSTTAETVHPAIGTSMAKRERSASRPKGQVGVSMVPPVSNQPQTSKSLLWVKPAQTHVDASTGMWAPVKDSASMSQATLRGVETDMLRQSRKSSEVTQDLDVQVSPDFGKQGMWKRRNNDPQSQNMDWLDITMNKRFSRVELRY
ncbi:hypothetical protein F5B20DRAFT_570700 [Whalleya microplaca]|nr:hypothetical protein F5B20DRAFT_570700 [Whalleya microplaca]